MNPTLIWRLGGVAALTIASGYVAIVVLYVGMGAPPHDTQARLVHFAGNTLSWQAILWLSVVTDLLFPVVAAALYVALQHARRYAMATASACVALFVILDLSVTWTNYAALLALSGKYARASNELQQAAIVAAAEYPSAVTDSGLLFFYNTLTLSVAILIAGLVMPGGRFSRLSARLGILTGLTGIVAVGGPILLPALSRTIIAASVFTTFWLLSLGYDLLKAAGWPRRTRLEPELPS